MVWPCFNLKIQRFDGKRMNIILYRLVVAAGAALFAMSFFLPIGFPNAPFGIFKWITGAISGEQGPWEIFGFSVTACFVVYPYLWNVVLALTSALLKEGTGRATKWIHLVFNLTGGLLIISLGVLLVAVKDTWIPPWVQWTAIFVPFLILMGMWSLTLILSEPRQTPAIVSLCMLPQIPAQFLIAHAVAAHNGPSWGFTLGGIGAILVVAASLMLCFTRQNEHISGQ
ncbi:MAG: hypothetical protein A2283_11350 [Lentisphaerae bacterium RIFOXYA12_FULL_48_11]|nr:MAG: hypothetical protein A2283_11350 [Lentisphaerae bacterium RIFOXYA12_FULL_48_11]